MSYFKKILFLLVIGVALVATSCSTTCMCQDNNSGYIYPTVDCEKKGLFNNCCKKVQKDMNADGKPVTCIKW